MSHVNLSHPPYPNPPTSWSTHYGPHQYLLAYVTVNVIRSNLRKSKQGGFFTAIKLWSIGVTSNMFQLNILMYFWNKTISSSLSISGFSYWIYYSHRIDPFRLVFEPQRFVYNLLLLSNYHHGCSLTQQYSTIHQDQSMRYQKRFTNHKDSSISHWDFSINHQDWSQNHYNISKIHQNYSMSCKNCSIKKY